MTENEAIEELKYDCNEIGKAIPCDTSWGESFENAYAMADAEFRRMRRNKTFRDMDENRRKGLYPICPKCAEVIDPVDIREWTRI